MNINNKWYCVTLVLNFLIIASIRSDGVEDSNKRSLLLMILDIEKSSMRFSPKMKENWINNKFDAKHTELTKNWCDEIIKLTKPLKDIEIDLEPHIRYIQGNVAAGNSYPSLRFSISNSSKPNQIIYEYYVDGNEEKKGFIKQNVIDKFKEEYNETCYDALNRVVNAFNLYKSDYFRFTIGKTHETLKLYSNQWEKYFTEARSQTFWELELNSFLYHDTITSKSFVPPPPCQWILFHPSVLVEYVSKAKDGNKFSEALALEWVGVNWWENSIIGCPIGISALSVYADRNNIDDFGHGIMLNINNNYSFGVTLRDGGDTGFFVTVDLLKLFENKQSNRDKMRRQIERLKN